MTALLLLTLATGLAAAPPDIPKTPAGARFEQWLTAFNSGDKAKIHAFHVDAMPPGEASDDKAEMVLGFHKDTGGFDLVSVSSPDPTHLTALLKERNSDRRARFEMEVEGTTPYKVANIELRPDGPPPQREAPPARVSESEALDALKAEAERRARDGSFSGAILVARNAQVLWKNAYGQADRAANVPNQTTTKFNLGSMNKMFTSVAIAQLVQKGKLSFDDPLGKYLPNYPNQETAAKVTIHHLLTHTGGTGDIFGPEFDKNISTLKNPGDYIKLYGSRAPAFAPGARHVYSNYGFVLLGAIIEQVSGMSYYDYVAKYIFEPAGMKDTASYWKDQKTPNMAVGYVKAKGELADNVATRPMRGSPAGGGYSTVEDLFRFANALLNNKLLNAGLTKTITEGKVDAPMPGVRCAYGFMDARQTGAHWFGHGGGAPGINAELRIFPETGYIVAAAANLDPPAAQSLSAFVANRLPAR